MTPPMNEAGTAYVVPVLYSESWLQVEPSALAEVVITLVTPEGAAPFVVDEPLFVSAHALVRAAVAAALEAVELTHPQMSPAIGEGEHDPARPEQTANETANENEQEN